MNFGENLARKLKESIRSKLQAFGAYVDDELPDYILVMLANRRTKETMLNELKLFLGANTSDFIDWLHAVLEKLQNEDSPSRVTAAPKEAVIPHNSSKKHSHHGTSTKDKHDSAQPKKNHNESNAQKLKIRLDYDEFAEEMALEGKMAAATTTNATTSFSRKHHSHKRSSDLQESKSSHKQRERSPVRTESQRHPEPAENRIMETGVRESVPPKIQDVFVASVVTSKVNILAKEEAPTIYPESVVQSVVKVTPRPKTANKGINSQLLRQAFLDIVADTKSNGQKQTSRRKAADNDDGEFQIVVDNDEQQHGSRRVILSHSHVEEKKEGKPQANFFVTMNGTVKRPSESSRRGVHERLGNVHVPEEVMKTTVKASDKRYIISMDEEDEDEDASENENMETVKLSKVKRQRLSTEEEKPPIVVEENATEVEMPNSTDDNVALNERCRFWPACRNGRDCVYLHPSEPCKSFPNCRFGNKCHYIHPPCHYNSLCTNLECPFLHTAPRNPVPISFARPSNLRPRMSSSFSPRIIPGASVGPRASVYAYHAGNGAKPNNAMPPAGLVKCRFHPFCANPRCTFWHPSTSTRGGKASVHKWVNPDILQAFSDVEEKAQDSSL